MRFGPLPLDRLEGTVLAHTHRLPGRVLKKGRRLEAADVEAFREFCDTHLAHLDAVALDYFGSERARNAVRRKVEALFPEHEWDEFTDLLWSRIQTWRERRQEASETASGEAAS